MPDTAYHGLARELHSRLYEWIELDGVQWPQIADRLSMPAWKLAKVRLAALDLGLAVKEQPGPRGRVRWLAPEPAKKS